MTELDLAAKPEDVEDASPAYGTTGQPPGRVDGANRYKIPHPQTGKPARWTRVTTFAKTLAETDGLQRWGERMVMKGLADRSDLLARVAITPQDQRRALDGIARDAKAAAGAWKKAGYGTTFHALTERVDLGDLDPFGAGPPWGSMLRAYVALLRSARVEILPEYVELTTVCLRYKTAGTFDRIVRMPNGELWIADLKTGRDLNYSWGEIAIQLALYAHADGIYDFDKGEYQPMPKVNLQQGLVIHAPVEGDHVALYRVNIEAGWEAAELCEKVRAYRTFGRRATNGLAAEVTRLLIPDDEPGLPRKWVSRIEAALSVSDLSLIWQEATAAGEWTEKLEALGHERGRELRNG